jgi:hypothetical protein
MIKMFAKPRVSHYQITTESGSFMHYATDKKECKKAAAEVCRKFGNTLGHTILKIKRIS